MIWFDKCDMMRNPYPSIMITHPFTPFHDHPRPFHDHSLYHTPTHPIFTHSCHLPTHAIHPLMPITHSCHSPTLSPRCESASLFFFPHIPIHDTSLPAVAPDGFVPIVLAPPRNVKILARVLRFFLCSPATPSNPFPEVTPTSC